MFAVFCTGPVWASGAEANLEFQDRLVTGKVISVEDSQGIPGVNIIIKGTSLGTVTDANGRYSLSAPAAESVLVFSSIGFSTTEVVVGSQSTIDVSLTADVTTLSEVIVTGYGTQEKRDVTASIASIKGDALVRVANPNTLEAMKGQIAGS